jgi:hypothetical protein
MAKLSTRKPKLAMASVQPMAFNLLSAALSLMTHVLCKDVNYASVFWNGAIDMATCCCTSRAALVALAENCNINMTRWCAARNSLPAAQLLCKPATC